MECLLIIVVTPTIEDDMVDWLLNRENLSGFTSTSVNGHSEEHQHLSLAEQVSGRQRQIMFHIHGEETVLSELLTQLQTDFRGSGVHYWMMPVTESGHLG